MVDSSAQGAVAKIENILLPWQRVTNNEDNRETSNFIFRRSHFSVLAHVSVELYSVFSQSSLVTNSWSQGSSPKNYTRINRFVIHECIYKNVILLD